MLISMKHDSANGEIGIAPSFGNRERMAAESFKKQILRDPGYIPEGIGEDVPFDSLLTAFYLVPDDRVVGVMWVYRDTEVLRRSLFFTTIKVSLEAGQDPYSVAAAISDGTLTTDIRSAVRSGNFELDLEISRNSGPFPADPEGVHLSELNSLPLLREVDIASSRCKSFKPFITFKPAEGRPRQGSTPRGSIDGSEFEGGQDKLSTLAAPRYAPKLPGQDREPAIRRSTPALADRDAYIRPAPRFRDLRLPAVLLLLLLFFAVMVWLGVNVNSLRKEVNSLRKELNSVKAVLPSNLEGRLEKIEKQLGGPGKGPNAPTSPNLATYVPIEKGPAGTPNLRSAPLIEQGNIVCELTGNNKLKVTAPAGANWLSVEVIEGPPESSAVQENQTPPKCSKGKQGFVSARAVKTFTLEGNASGS